MSADGRSGLVDLAASVADGTAVDWEAAEREAADPRERRLVRQLRVLSHIAEVHRTLVPADEPVRPAGAMPATWGPLAVLDRVGAGSSAEVFLAVDTQLHREVALKLLASGVSARAEARLLEEARLLARVRHPNVVIVHGAERHEGRAGLWMEFIRGFTLEDLLRRSGPFGPRETCAIGTDVCQALAAVHAAGLVHGDVKAQNVMREQGGRIVLMDFGTGGRLDEAGQAPRAGGTPLYMAPEVLAGAPPTVRSDVYSVGVLLYHLVSGSFPVTGGSIEELREAHRRGVRRPLRDVRPDLPAAFIEVIERATATDPSARYESAGALEAALRSVLAQPAIPAPVEPGAARPSAAPRAGRRAPVRQVVLAAAAAV
ncbi:MAG TPA: serine/threonine-protein kinase, partial [Vicinamibacterales bacterium]|nr:serine/threonine-protein kinase [Vicinamibacterales bacterium]